MRETTMSTEEQPRAMVLTGVVALSVSMVETARLLGLSDRSIWRLKRRRSLRNRWMFARKTVTSWSSGPKRAETFGSACGYAADAPRRGHRQRRPAEADQGFNQASLDDAGQ